MGASSKEPLTSGFHTASVVRCGDTVRRTAGPWSPAVHAWLAHLAKLGLDVGPRPLSLELATGTEVLSYVDGTVIPGGTATPYLWSGDTLVAIARLIRRFHDASTSFSLPPGVVWQSTVAYPGGGDVICHNDLAPWNTVFVDEQPVAFVDWDSTAPGPRLWDVVYALWHFVPFYGDPSRDPFPVDEFEPRAARARAFCDAYGLQDRSAVIDLVVERQLATFAVFEEGAKAGDPPYVLLWSMGAGPVLQREMNYVRGHRAELEHALA